MTAAGATLAQLERALDQTGALIARVRPEQASLPTPCRAWDVRGLVNHVVHDVQGFGGMVGGAAWQQRDDDVIGADWAGAYNAAAAALLDAWRRRDLDEPLQRPSGSLPASWALGQQVSDLAVHAWDIAKATGQPTALDPELGQVSLEWARENLHPRFRGEEGSGQAFGLEVPVPNDAPLYDRLAAFFGRDPR